MDPTCDLLDKLNTVFQSTRKRFVAFFLKIFIDLLSTEDFSVADSVFKLCKISHMYVAKVFQHARGDSGYFVTSISQ